MIKARSQQRYSVIGLIGLIYLAFIALGMSDSLKGVAWPSMRADFSLPIDALGAMMFAATAGYMISSFVSSKLLSRLGIGKMLAISFALMATTLLGYTLVPAWWMVVLLSVAGGLGAGAVDGGLNTYVAANYDEKIMQWLHASYGVGATLGPAVMTFALTSLNSWRAGYQAVVGIQVVLVIVFTLCLPVWKRNEQPAETAAPKKLTDYRTPIRETLKQPRAWLSALLFFLYVGAEMAIGAWTFSLLTESRGISVGMAGFITGSFWGMFTIGRFVAGFFAKKVSVNAMVQGSLVGALAGGLLLVWNPLQLANLLAVAVIGFSFGPIFAALMSGTSQRVGEHYAANTIGMQMAATGLGGATIPALLGVLAKQVSLEAIPICLVVVFASLLGVYRISMFHTNQVVQEKAA